MPFRKIYFSLVITTWLCVGLTASGQDTASYFMQDLNFLHKRDTLYGKLILPKGHTGKLPVIVFVHGSGPEDYSSSDNYRYLWEAFTQIGFACYSWDRPGVGQSQGKWYTCSVEDRADEVVSAVNKLKTSAEIDALKIGFWGISQAGWVIPIAAKKIKPAFVITVSSPVTTAFEQELYRVQSEMKAEGFSKADIDKAVAYNNKLRKLIQANQPYDRFVDLQKEIKSAAWADNVISGEEVVYNYLSIVFKKDNAPDLRGLQCPVLAIWGANDLVVPPQKSFAFYKKQLAGMGNTHVLTRIIPDADHTLTFNQSGKRSETIKRREEYKSKPEAIFAPGYVSLMTSWLKTLQLQ